MQENEYSRGIDSEAARRETGTLAAATVASAATVLALWILAAVLWPKLPERIPAHFDFEGRPTRWEPI